MNEKLNVVVNPLKRRKTYHFKNFNKSWETNYFFTLISEKTSKCLICSKIINNKLSNFKRHYQTLHATHYERFCLSERISLIDTLKEEHMKVDHSDCHRNSECSSRIFSNPSYILTDQFYNHDTRAKECIRKDQGHKPTDYLIEVNNAEKENEINSEEVNVVIKHEPPEDIDDVGEEMDTSGLSTPTMDHIKQSKSDKFELDCDEEYLTEDLFYFGRYVAAQLRRLPVINALRCQKAISEIISNELINVLEPNFSQNQTLQMALQPPMPAKLKVSMINPNFPMNQTNLDPNSSSTVSNMCFSKTYASQTQTIPNLSQNIAVLNQPPGTQLALANQSIPFGSQSSNVRISQTHQSNLPLNQSNLRISQTNNNNQFNVPLSSPNLSTNQSNVFITPSSLRITQSPISTINMTSPPPNQPIPTSSNMIRTLSSSPPLNQPGAKPVYILVPNSMSNVSQISIMSSVPDIIPSASSSAILLNDSISLPKVSSSPTMPPLVPATRTPSTGS